MVIKEIKIGNFRNIESAEFTVSPKLNFFVGNNAQGKTNLVEAIYTAAFLKSFRTQNIEETIKENSSRATIEIEVNNQSVNNIINFSYDKKNKILTIDKKKPEYNKYYSLLNVVIFYPEEVNYLSNYPLFRRNLLDRSIFYSNFDYINVYKKYVRCLKQRNSYLKKDSRDVDCWTDQLIAYGSEIVKERLLYIEKINNYFKSFNFKKINGENYYLSYSKTYNDLEKIEECLKEEFYLKKEREKHLGYTLVGPHRDDIIFYINNKQADKYSSQGQKRSLIISFKSAQVQEFKNIHGYSPILILDDMNSELDSHRKNQLLDNMLKGSGQVFITSTEFNRKYLVEDNKIYNVKKGVVSLSE